MKKTMILTQKDEIKTKTFVLSYSHFKLIVGRYPKTTKEFNYFCRLMFEKADSALYNVVNLYDVKRKVKEAYEKMDE